MPYTVSVTLNRPEIAALLIGRARRIGQAVQRGAQRRAPKETGRLASSIYVTVGYVPGIVFADIGTNLHYAIYQHEGTGIYAGRGMIVAKSGRVMRFKPGRRVGPLPKGVSHPTRAARPWVYARAVKGLPPNPFLVQALNDVVGSVARITRGRGRR